MTPTPPVRIRVKNCGHEITDLKEAGFINDYKKMEMTFFKVTYIFIKEK